MDNKELLKNYREQIDTLDKELIYLLFRRFEIVKQVWEVKKQEGITNPLDENRWKKLMDENLEVSRDFWLDDELITDLWNRLHKESLKLEK